VMGYLVNMVFFAMFLLHVNTWARFRRMLLVILAGALMFAYFETTLGDFRGGRYHRLGSMMYDPNDVAFVVISFLPYVLGVVLGIFGGLTKGVAGVGVLSLILLNLYTGSR